MDKYHDQLKRAKHYLLQGDFDLCSILCGKTMESVLKDLLNKYQEEATHDEKQPIQRYLTSKGNRLTIGKAVNLFERNNILSSLARNKRSVDDNEIRFLDLRKMVEIRNRAIHDHEKNRDLNLEESDAYIMYGSLLRLIMIDGRLLESQPGKQLLSLNVTVETDRGTRRIIYPGINKSPSPKQTQNIITLFKNKSSGKCFVHLEDEGSNKILLVMPDGQIKALDRTLFTGPIDEEEDRAVKNGLILAEQLKHYHEYVNQQGEKLTIRPQRTEIKTKTDCTISHPTIGQEDWVIKGVRFPIGTEFRASYKGQTHYGKVEGGGLVVDRKRFDSPSSAAVAITRNSVNGWIFWECRMPSKSSWQKIKSLRK